MRLSCQLRKYLSQFVACNGLALLDPWLHERDHRPIGATYYGQLVGVCRPTAPSFFLYLLYFPLFFISFPLVSSSRLPGCQRKDKEGTSCHAQKPRRGLPFRRSGNVPLAVAFDRSTFSNRSLHALSRIDVSLILCNFIRTSDEKSKESDRVSCDL